MNCANIFLIRVLMLDKSY